MIGPMRILRVILALIFVAFVLEPGLLAIPGGGSSGHGGPPPPTVDEDDRGNVKLTRPPADAPPNAGQ